MYFFKYIAITKYANADTHTKINASYTYKTDFLFIIFVDKMVQSIFINNIKRGNRITFIVSTYFPL